MQGYSRVKHYNGLGNNYDIASGVVVDLSGNVYVTGASLGFGFALIDYVTIKYNSSGTQQWATRYNYSNGMDIPAGITLDNTGNVIVSGSSASSSINNDWDFAIVKYNASTGTQMQVQRQANTGSAQDKVIAQTKDNSGNIYTTGITSSNGTNFNVQTIKYDANMNLLWVQNFDGYGKDDQGTDIAVDNAGNVIVTGYSTLTNLTKELLVLSYSPSGILNWNGKKQPVYNASNAEGVKVRIKNNNEIFIGGNYTIGTNQDMVIVRFNTGGELNLEKIYNGTSNLNDKLLDLLIDGNYIIVSGLTNNGTINQNVTIKYEYKDFILTPAINAAGSDYNLNNIIIAFNKNALKMNVINNKDKLFGVLGDFVSNATCKKIDSIIGPNFKSASFSARKIFHNMTEADSLSISRQGDIIKVPYFYTNLLVQLPSGYNIKLAVDTLKYLKPDFNYAEYNYLYRPHFVPNDPFYANQQASLHPTATYSAANINCEPAWNYTKGQAFIKVAINDSGIDYTNPDLAGTVVGGYDEYLNTTYSNIDYLGHGTACAGIVGAKTNNGIGVAGIAGGDGATSQAGISLYTFRIINGAFLTNDHVKAVIVRGANIDGVNIMNNSYGTATSDAFLVDGVNYANRCGIAFVASKGNYGSTGVTTPACLKESIILCVGASGTDGNFQWFANGDNYTTNYGYPLDYLAPGGRLLISTTGVTTSANTTTFNGTSAAAPHVTGIVALLMSYRNHPTAHWDNLTGEDCDNIIKKSCKDLTGVGGEVVGYDSESGYGLVNAGKALDTVAYPKFNIKHIDVSHNCTSFAKVTNTVLSNQLVYFSGDSIMAQGNYYANVYEIFTTLNYSLNPTETVLSAWPMTKASFGCGFYNDSVSTDEPWFCEVISYNNNQAVLRTYATKLLTTSTGGIVNYDYPALTSIKSAITLHTYDPNGAISIKENLPFINLLNIYPNPAKSNFNVGINSNINSNACSLTVIDIIGNSCYQKNISISQGVNEFTIDAKHLQTGVYFVTFTLDGKTIKTKKLIIN